MASQQDIYKCDICGQIVEVLHGAAGTLVCCGKDMQLQVAGSVDAATEKHVPVVEKSGATVKVKVGAVNHPMEEKHYIEWIELQADGIIYRRHLNPGDAPEAEFCVTADQLTARAYCNLHGLWKG